jgi:branched-chain amino acid transport system substrate-binding protein
MYMSGPYLDPAIPAYADFLAKWTAKYGGQPPSGYHAFAYDATNIFFAAIEAVAVVDADDTVHIGRQALRDAVYGTTDFDALSGKLTCNENGDCATGEALGVYQIGEAEVGGNWPPPIVWRPGQ